MTMDSATVVELVNMILGLLIAGMAIHAQKRINFALFKRGLNMIAVSGGIMAIIAPFRAYYTYTDSYELIVFGRAFLTAAMIILIIGLYVVGKAALELCGEEGKSECNRT
ncbi:MAG: hypothetical protein U9O85_04000 [Euryarchaeota archaeon]|nr:hypothetical protein [Euryarchaeota archaeon]